MLFAYRLAALTTIAALAAAPMAWSQTGAPTREAFDKANQAIKAAVDANPDQLPHLDDPTLGSQLRIAHDPAALRLFSFDDPAEGADICTPGIDALEAYVLGSAINGTHTEQVRVSHQNADRYHDEQALIMSFVIDCFGGVASALQVYWGDADAATLAEHREAIDEGRDGTAMVYDSSLRTMLEKPYTLANKRQILAALVRNADHYVQIMTLAHRTALLERIDTVSASADPSLKADLTRLRASLAAKVCVSLCRA